jgi:hypothetical protein
MLFDYQTSLHSAMKVIVSSPQRIFILVIDIILGHCVFEASINPLVNTAITVVFK